MFEQFTRTHVTVGRVFGIPVGLNYSWFAVFVVVLWTLATGYFPQVAPGTPLWTIRFVSAIAALAFFGSILAHEFGHALAARHCGIEVRGVTLFVLGGVSRIAAEPRTAGEELYIAAAGPMVSLGLAIGGYLVAVVAPKSAVMTALFAYLVLVNLALAAFNLVPALPLDGGRVLRALIWAVCGDGHRATRYCARGGRACGIGMVASGIAASALGGFLLGFWLVVIGVFIERSARSSGTAAANAEREAISLQRAPAPLHTSTGGTWEMLAPVFAEGAGDGRRYARGMTMGIEKRYHDLLERVVGWRARLDVLPRPGEISEEESAIAPQQGLEYQEARIAMYDRLNDIDVKVRSRLDENDIERKFADLSSLYDEWRSAEHFDASGVDDPGDSILSGRPVRFAPSPEEVLQREPGSSAEV